MKTNGENIKKIRELRNYNQSYMANKLGMSQENYSYLETKQKHISDELLFRIANLLNVSSQLITNFNADRFLSEYDEKYNS